MAYNSILDTQIKELWPLPKLRERSLDKRFTRHWCNLALTLHPNELSLFSWLVYMSCRKNTFEWSVKLSKQYQKASELAVEYYKVENIIYSTSGKSVYKSFKWLIERGLIIKMTDKKRYMINPMIVYPASMKGADVQKKYLELMESAGDSISDKEKELTKLCDRIYNL